MKCIYCNSENEKEALFCTSCGKELPKQKRCIKCGKEIDDDCEWCTHCGAKQAAENKAIVIEHRTQSKKSNKPALIISVLLGICFIGGGIIFFSHKQLSNSNRQRLIADSIHRRDSIEKRAADSTRVADSIAAIEAIAAAEYEQESDYTLCPEPRCGGIEVTNVTAKASNTLNNQEGNSYKASNLLDNDSNTTWATHFTGNEETLTFSMNIDGLYKIFLVNGYNKSSDTFDNNSRAKDIKVYVNGILASKDELGGNNYHFPEYIIFNKEYNDVKEVKIVISSVHRGYKWNDLCISDVCFFTKE